MCGILGSINLPFGASTLDTISHRGPDDSAISFATVGPHSITLGHRRLSIVDLSPAGRQPMWTSDSAHALVFNGEIYNHSSIRASLPAHAWRGHSDTETLLHALVTRGPSVIPQLNGIFAFAHLDIHARRLLLARDPFGVKPLYYWCDGASFVFSSELRAIRALTSDTLDPDALASLLRLRYLPSPDTLFKNIRKLHPGHLLHLDLSQARLEPHESPFFIPPSPDPLPLPLSSATEQYGNLLEQAVRSQLMSDVEIGVLLSGGVDSALVALLAQRHTSRPMKAFTVGFNDASSADETASARRTANALGLDHHTVSVDFPLFLDILPKITEIVEEPLATTSVVPMFFLSKLAAQHVKVVLSGQGADEACGGYRRYQAELLAPRLPRFAFPLLASAAAHLSPQRDSLHRAIRSLAEPHDLNRFLNSYTVFSPSEIQTLTGRKETRALSRLDYFYRLLGCARFPTPAQRMMSLDLRLNLADDLLLYTDKITMHHALECRVPLLDLTLVSFLESLPLAHRIRLLHGKFIHKRFAHSQLPPGIARGRKKGFLSPTASWFRQSGPLSDILLNPRSRFASHFHLPAVSEVLRQHAAGYNRERQIFLLLGLACWMDSQLAPASREPEPSSVLS